jgi:hypothetical protein
VLKLAADEDFNNNMVLGVLRRNPDVDIMRVQEAGLSGAEDPSVLKWAAEEGRVLFTHDVNTMTDHAYQRINAGETMPGLFAVPRSVPIGTAIEDMLLIAECSVEGEYEGQVHYLPLQ